MELEIAKLKIALNLQQQCTNAAVNDLAAAQVRIAELEAKIAELTRDVATPPPK